MSKKNPRYQVLGSPKLAGVGVREAQAALASAYPLYNVEVHDAGNEYVAKLYLKNAADDEDDDDGDGGDANKPGGKVPPFVDEKNDDGGDGGDKDGGNPFAKKPKNDDGDGGEDGEDGGGESPEETENDLSKALKALDTLKHVLPALEKQLHGLVELGGGPTGPTPPGGLGGPPGAGGPPHVGPTPGAPPSAAGGPGAGGPPKPGAATPGLNGGPGKFVPKPQVGVPTFSSNVKQNRFVYRPVDNGDGTKVSVAQATQEIASHPKYAAYEVQDVKLDEDSQQIVAHLKLRKG